MMKKSTTRRALAALICGIAAFALTALLAGCGNEEDALPEENVKYEIALVTDDSLVMDGGHSTGTAAGRSSDAEPPSCVSVL